MKLILLASLVQLSVAVIIDCDFKDDTNGMYTCSVTGDLETDDIDNFVSEINGIHLNGKTNDDVKKISILDKSTEYFPGGLSNFFPNLDSIKVEKSKLKYIFKDDLAGLSQLKYFYVGENKIEALGPSLFEDNPVLEEIHFENNKISKISDDLLSYSNAKFKIVHLFGNECIKEDLDIPNVSGSDIKKMIQEKCQMKGEDLADIVDTRIGKLKNQIVALQEKLADAEKKDSHLPSKESEKESKNMKSQIEKLKFDKENLDIQLSVAKLTLEENEIVMKNLTKAKENLEETLTKAVASELKLKALNEKLESAAAEQNHEIEKLSNELGETVKDKEKIEKSSRNEISSLKSVNNELRKQITFSSANDAHYDSLKARYHKEKLESEKLEEIAPKMPRMSKFIKF